ncbi:MAG TPA: hypothetical protein VLB90_05015 [Pseudomonadales bacterium]|nr:hypothetical protein [Pseudomonadales bacterium]
MQIFKILVINLVILSVLMIGIEASLRLQQLQSPIAFSYNYHQDFPGIKKIVPYTIYKGDYRSFHPIEFQKKAPRTIRILCIGASTTLQITQAYKDTWCGLIESRLSQEFPGRHFESAIFAQQGWLAIDNYLWLEKNLSDTHADIVISLLGINDMMWNGYPSYSYTDLETKKAFWLQFRRAYDPLYQPSLQSIGENIDNISLQSIIAAIFTGKEWATYKRLLDIKAKIINARLSFDYDHTSSAEAMKRHQELPLTTEITRNPDPITEFGDVVNAIVDLHAKQGISLIMLGQPVLWANDDLDPNAGSYWFSLQHQGGAARLPSKALSAMMEHYNAIQENAAREHHQSYVNLNNRIPKSREYFLDDCHFTDIGSAVVAETIYPAIAQQIALLKEKTQEE